MSDMKFKICLLGDAAVGKTSLIRRFVIDKFDDKYLSTLGTKVSKKMIHRENVDMTLMIWDLTGQKEFKNMRLAAYQNASGAFIVCDITRMTTIDNITLWKEEFAEVAGDVPVFLLFNKCDLIMQEAVSEEWLGEISRTLRTSYFLTSAKTGENVENAFLTIGKMLIERGIEVSDEEANATPITDVETEATLLTVEDEVITTFCQMMGDDEFAMAAVRKQFMDAEVDFRNPTMEQLMDITARLDQVLQNFRGETVAKQARQDFQRLFKKLEVGGVAD